MAWGRKDKSCPRCQELLNGAKPRAGWQRDYYATKRLADTMRKHMLAKHNCKTHGCAPICVFGDW